MNQSKTTILIADDEEDFCVILSHVMTREGFEVRTVNAGKAALDSIISEEPDVLLVDFRMPDMDGMEVLMRGEGKQPGVASHHDYRLCRHPRSCHGDEAGSTRLSCQARQQY